MKKDRILFFYDQEQNKEAHSHHLSSTLKRIKGTHFGKEKEHYLYSQMT